eukprot:gene9879-51_t
MILSPTVYFSAMDMACWFHSLATISIRDIKLVTRIFDTCIVVLQRDKNVKTNYDDIDLCMTLWSGVAAIPTNFRPKLDGLVQHFSEHITTLLAPAAISALTYIVRMDLGNQFPELCQLLVSRCEEKCGQVSPQSCASMMNVLALNETFRTPAMAEFMKKLVNRCYETKRSWTVEMSVTIFRSCAIIRVQAKDLINALLLHCGKAAHTMNARQVSAVIAGTVRYPFLSECGDCVGRVIARISQINQTLDEGDIHNVLTALQTMRRHDGPLIRKLFIKALYSRNISHKLVHRMGLIYRHYSINLSEKEEAMFVDRFRKNVQFLDFPVVMGLLISFSRTTHHVITTLLTERLLTYTEFAFTPALAWNITRFGSRTKLDFPELYEALLEYYLSRDKNSLTFGTKDAMVPTALSLLYKHWSDWSSRLLRINEKKLETDGDSDPDEIFAGLTLPKEQGQKAYTRDYDLYQCVSETLNREDSGWLQNDNPVGSHEGSHGSQ